MILNSPPTKLHVFLTAGHLTKPSVKGWQYEIPGAFDVRYLGAVYRMCSFCALLLEHIYEKPKIFGMKTERNIEEVQNFGATQMVKTKT